MEVVTVRIRDHEYLVKGGETEEQAYRIAEYVNDKLKEVEDHSEDLSEKKAIILAALNIASDYFHVLRERDEILAENRERTEALINHIDSVMG